MTALHSFKLKQYLMTSTTERLKVKVDFCTVSAIHFRSIPLLDSCGKEIGEKSEIGRMGVFIGWF